MYKVMAMLKRQPHLTHAQFVRHYEGWHAPWAYRKFCQQHVRRYVRHYVARPADGPEPPYDVITEFWFNSEAEYQDWRRFKEEHAEAAALKADEESFFDRASAVVVVVTPVETIAPIPAARPEPGE